MIEVTIPGYKTLQLDQLVLDYNGTLACDGRLEDGVKDALTRLAERLAVHVVTADTFGLARAALEEIPCELVILPEGRQDEAKRDYVDRLGAGRTVSIGNGRNDHRMLAHSALGLAVMLGEGVAVETLCAADVCFTRIADALTFLLNPLRMTATLRS